MVLDDKKINELLDGLMMKAKEQRMEISYSNEEGFPQVLVFLGPNFEVSVVPALWKDERDKYRFMRAVSETAKRTLTRAIVLVTDTRWTTSDIGPALGIGDPKEIGEKEWQKQYHRILTEKYDGQLKNLPRELWQEAILVVMKGPELKGKIPTRMARYKRGENDSIRWIPHAESNKENTIHFNLLPDWWD